MICATQGAGPERYAVSRPAGPGEALLRLAREHLVHGAAAPRVTTSSIIPEISVSDAPRPAAVSFFAPGARLRRKGKSRSRNRADTTLKALDEYRRFRRGYHEPSLVRY